MQKALKRDQQECIGCAADQEAAGAATATLAGLTRALCAACLRRLLTLRPAAGSVGGPAEALTVRMAMSSVATAAAAELERRDRSVSVRLCEALGCGNTLQGRGPRARTCSPTCSNRVSARRGMHRRRHPGCARDPVLDPHRHLASGGVE